jgi:hypothetical protein
MRIIGYGGVLFRPPPRLTLLRNVRRLSPPLRGAFNLHRMQRALGLAPPGVGEKSKRTHVLPLSDAARAILKKFRDEQWTYVFGLADAAGFNGWGYAKRTLDVRIAEDGKPFAHWTLHDLRRRARSAAAHHRGRSESRRRT